MDIGLVSGLEANTEDLSTVSRNFSEKTIMFAVLHPFSVGVVVQHCIIISSLLLNPSNN